MIATLFDTNALLDVLLASFGATLALVVAFGKGVLAIDRIAAERGRGRATAPGSRLSSWQRWAAPESSRLASGR
jgi:hypothetical protein